MYVLACNIYLILLVFTVNPAFIRQDLGSRTPGRTQIKLLKASLQVRKVESVWRTVLEEREWRVWKSQQDRWGLQSLPLPTLICSAHPCMWESVCCRLTQGLSITPFTQGLKFPLLWYVGLPWSYCEPAEAIVVAYSEVSHCVSAVGLLFGNIVCLCEQPGENKWLPRIQPPTLNERCYIIPTITHWDEGWPVSTGLCTSQSVVKCIKFALNLEFVFCIYCSVFLHFKLFVMVFVCACATTSVCSHTLGSSQSAFRVGPSPHVYTWRSELFLQLWAAGRCIAPHSQSDTNNAACVCAIVMTKP